MAIVHEIEDDYGSIDAAPWDEPRFQVTRKLGRDPKEPVRPNAYEKCDSIMSEIETLWQQGYTDPQICQKLIISVGSVRYRRAMLGKPNIKVWRLKSGAEERVFNAQYKVQSFLDVAYYKGASDLKKIAEKQGWTLTEEYSHEY